MDNKEQNNVIFAVGWCGMLGGLAGGHKARTRRLSGEDDGRQEGRTPIANGWLEREGRRLSAQAGKKETIWANRWCPKGNPIQRHLFHFSPFLQVDIEILFVSCLF